MGVGMSAFEELNATAEFGVACYQLFLDKAKQVTRRYNFPPPEGSRAWDDDAWHELVQDVLATKGKTLILALMACATEDQVERLAATAIRNILRDQAKSTELGKLRRRVEGLLDDDARFVGHPGDRWGISGGPRSVGTQELEKLQFAARRVSGVAITLPLNAGGPTPANTVAALTTVAYAVIEAAEGTVSIQTLTAIVAERFSLLVTPTSLYDEEGAAFVVPSERPDSADAAVELRLGYEVWLRLDEAERAAVRCLDNLADVQRVLRCGRREAIAVVDRIQRKIGEVATDPDAQRAVASGIVAIVTTLPPAAN